MEFSQVITNEGPDASKLPGYTLSDTSLLFPGCHLYAINTHHSRELRIVVAIRNKLLLITRKHKKPSGGPGLSSLSPVSESPVEEFQYIRVGCFALQSTSLLATPA